MRRSLIRAGAATSVLVGWLAGAHAQQPIQRVQVGVLKCRGGASIGFVVGWSPISVVCCTSMACRTTAISPPSARSASISASHRSWRLPGACMRPTARLGPGDLSGNYAGAQGSASVGVGVGGNVLVGGSNNSIRAAAAERAGPGRPQCRGRGWKASNFGRADKLLTRKFGYEGPKKIYKKKKKIKGSAKSGRLSDLALQRRFSGLPNCSSRGSIELPTQSRAELQRGGGNGTRRQKSPRSTVYCTGGPFPER